MTFRQRIFGIVSALAICGCGVLLAEHDPVGWRLSATGVALLAVTLAAIRWSSADPIGDLLATQQGKA